MPPQAQQTAKTNSLARPSLSAWLALFSTFTNSKALYGVQELRGLYTSLLSHPDRDLQRLALECTLTFREPSLQKHAEALKALLDDVRWRDELTGLDVSALDPPVADVLVRLLFGAMLEKKGKGRGRGKGVDRRAAVLAKMGACGPEEVGTLVELMLAPITRQSPLRETDSSRDPAQDSSHNRDEQHLAKYTVKSLAGSVTDKQLVGFLTLLGDVMKNLGTRLLPRWKDLFEALLDVTAHAQVRVGAHGQETPGTEDADDKASEDGPEGESGAAAGRAIRTVRQLGLKRFTEFFCSPVAGEFEFAPYIAEAFRAFISPRVPLLAIENTQAPTALLELFHAWSRQLAFASYLVKYDGRVLPGVYGCLVATGVKPTVVLKVFDIVDCLLELSATHEDIKQSVFMPHIPVLLSHLATQFERMKGTAVLTDQLGRRQIHILSQLSPYMADSAQASALLALFTPILRKPSKVVPEKLKVDMLNIVCSLLPLVDAMKDHEAPIYVKTYSLLAYLFQSLRSRQARLALVSTFRTLAELDLYIGRLAILLDSLNAYSTKRMDEPDFEKRMNAFGTLNEELHVSLTPTDWLPILHNMLNFIQDPDELSVRSSAAEAMKRFIDRVASDGNVYENTFTKILFPGIKNGLRSRNELVRAELLSVLSYSIQKCERVTVLCEMRPLLAAGDEEANFFNNVLHLQTHRRTRALRRLVELCADGQMRSTTLADIFVPLVGNFTTSGTQTDHHLINEAINTLGGLAKQLQWGAYHSTVQQYLRLIRNKDSSERIYVRTLVSLLDNFHFPMDSVVEVNQAAEEIGDAEGDFEPQEEAEPVSPPMPDQRTMIADVVNAKLLPSLLHHLEKREETDDSLRIPIAIGIIQVAKHLPQSTRGTQILRLITVLCQVFRSKSQETRDLARETLCKIAIVLGPSYLPEILRELRGALLRGPHLHVLAFVTHALLVHVTSGDNAPAFKVLDDCVSDVAHVSAEVIFGESGKDVQSENFKTKMREVRSSAAKGLDSFATIAKHITPPKISSLLVPIRKILQHTETLKMMQQVEDLLRRIAGGLNANEHLTPADLLALCHTLISQNAKFLQHVPKPPQRVGKGKVDAVVEMKKNLQADADHYANNSFRYT